MKIEQIYTTSCDYVKQYCLNHTFFQVGHCYIWVLRQNILFQKCFVQYFQYLFDCKKTSIILKWSLLNMSSLVWSSTTQNYRVIARILLSQSSFEVRVLTAADIQIWHISDFLLLISRFRTIPHGHFYTQNEHNNNTFPTGYHKTLCNQ